MLWNESGNWSSIFGGSAWTRTQNDDGTRIEDVEIVLFATGYRSGAPILPQELRDTDPRLLYKHMIDPDVGASLIRIGFALGTIFGFGSLILVYLAIGLIAD